MGKYRNRHSFYNNGPRASGETEDWEPTIDKNPFYRTMDIFNGVFRKNIKLAAGKHNSTDLKTIYVNFNEKKPSYIKAILGPDGLRKTTFLLECGHEWVGLTYNDAGNAKLPGVDEGLCVTCGVEQAYRGFEHEWQHVIFKSDLILRKIFCEEYANQLQVQIAGRIPRAEVVNFLSLLVNAFDDLRVNSLWEKVYPGSATAIWERWKWYTEQRGDEVNKSFLSYIFAVTFNIPTDPQGEFEAMRPVIEWAVQKVKYRGFANMLIDVRVVIDRCMGALLAKLPPPQQDTNDSKANSTGAQKQESKGSPGQEAGGQSQAGQEAIPGSSQGQSNPQMEEEGGSEGSQAAGIGAQEVDAPSNGSRLGNIPSASSVTSTAQERGDALQRLMDDAKPLDDAEEHTEASNEDIEAAKKSQSTRLMVAKALNQDIQDLDALDSKMPTGEPDPDMKGQLDQLQAGIASKSETSQLTASARARVAIIDVTNSGVPDEGSTIELGAEERYFVQRMRSAFFRSLGRQKVKMSSAGTTVDVQSLIQYLGDHQDANVFENEDTNQGFAYSVVCDMSGSMHGTFPIVCSAVEMLKQALQFPFVVGNLWGFRGGGRVEGRSDDPGEVWMYRYAKDVNWYTGTVPYRTHQGFNGIVQMPVKCGGITPMNAAVNVTAAHLWKKMPVGMAKRMFLLTDGSPVQRKVDGSEVPEYVLRALVAKEIRDARKHGVQVYTIVIGQHSIDEEKCLEMFGPRRFWKRVGADKVGQVLSELVLANFSKYIKARG